MPSFKRGVAPVEAAPPSFASGMPQSPSFRMAALNSSNSFSARRIHMDFRRSLPGAGGGVVSTPGEVLPGRNSNSGARLTSDYGGEAFPPAHLVGDSPALSEHGGAPPPDDDEATEQDVDAALQMLGRRHSFFPIRDSNSPSTSGSMRGLRNSMRVTEDEDFMHRLQVNRSSWKERARAGSTSRDVGPTGSGGGGPGATGEGLQNQTHAALEQLRGELKSLSMRSMHGGEGAVRHVPLPSMAAVPGAGSGGGGGAGVALHSSHNGPLSASVVPASSVPQWGGSTPPGTSSVDRERGPFGRISEGQSQLSPSRLSISNRDAASSGGAGDMSPLSSIPSAPSPLRNTVRHSGAFVGARE
ncbi:hypothetical protein CHLRE_12g531850v5 [Chlamydomonas reinhardtii]|uniref:Uncharacterized protein n=1 Tax=Chlamydomonas reinhardtii TaxID=3055 RepID=A0A2K3D4U6_CHLRE|nr:uncharacterized protein CHLRE_12g531850v5 [Chlamydomonas reinhardtii]PNW75566.1 hypothetical protein CHLRE_12g531850v5 [Chlamydomonas reinhardtii]